MSDFHNDDLSDLIGGAPKAPVSRAPVDFKPVLERVFTENCPKCYGTGRYGSYGPCFKCQGSGRLTFKSAPEVRAQNRAQSAERRTAKRVEHRIETLAAAAAFEAANPQMVAWLKAASRRNTEGRGNFGFPQDMLNAIHQYGSLTERQQAAVERLMARDVERKTQVASRAETAPAVNVAALEEAFGKASAKLGRPRLRVAGFTISHAPATGSNPGALYVKDENRTYMGKIVGGKFLRSRECDQAKEQAVLAVAADPKGAAIAYGRLTGSCAICARTLENAESIERGIGPICAEKFGW